MYLYKLPKCGTDKIIGVGMMGNLQIIIHLYYHYDFPIYADMYSNGNCITYDKEYEKDFNIINPFEYYFDFKHKDKNFEHEIYIPKNHYDITALNYGNYNLKYMDIYRNIREKFFQCYSFKNDIVNFTNEYEEEYFKNKIILGVHIRCTDMVSTKQNKNCFYFIDKIKHVLAKHNIDKIFIASDSNEVVCKVIDIFGKDKILAINNIERVNTIDDPTGSHHRINTDIIKYSSRKYHNYLCGKEVLIDMLLLSKCNYLIRSFSCVSDMAIFFNDKMSEVYN